MTHTYPLPMEPADHWLLLCMTREEIIKELHQIPLQMMYKGMGLVNIVDVIEVFDRASRPESKDVLLKQTLEEMQRCLREIQGRVM